MGGMGRVGRKKGRVDMIKFHRKRIKFSETKNIYTFKTGNKNVKVPGFCFLIAAPITQ